MIKDELYTPEELADILKISKYTVYEMIKRGDLPAHRIGRSLRISDQQLERFLKKEGSGENVFQANIIEEEGITYAEVDGIKIRVATDIRGKAQIHIPPQSIFLSDGIVHSTARNQLKGIVDATSEVGLEIIASLKIIGSDHLKFKVSLTKDSLKEFNIGIDKELYLFFKVMSVEVF